MFYLFGIQPEMNLVRANLLCQHSIHDLHHRAQFRCLCHRQLRHTFAMAFQQNQPLSRNQERILPQDENPVLAFKHNAARW